MTREELKKLRDQVEVELSIALKQRAELDERLDQVRTLRKQNETVITNARAMIKFADIVSATIRDTLPTPRPVESGEGSTPAPPADRGANAPSRETLPPSPDTQAAAHELPPSNSMSERERIQPDLPLGSAGPRPAALLPTPLGEGDAYG